MKEDGHVQHHVFVRACVCVSVCVCVHACVYVPVLVMTEELISTWHYASKRISAVPCMHKTYMGPRLAMHVHTFLHVVLQI